MAWEAPWELGIGRFGPVTVSQFSRHQRRNSGQKATLGDSLASLRA